MYVQNSAKYNFLRSDYLNEMKRLRIISFICSKFIYLMLANV